ncbi:recombinase family protein [Mariniflexile soesokkakense]|uniref:Recombinase family protein n=1 Tax=Mariniflexile soesokkakense TaxID=1343160 RepID=A0ABV0ABJ3_9FLAO
MKYVTYCRVSTKKQSLGLDAQQTIINRYLKSSDEVVSEFVEKETGTNKKVRIQLTKAIEVCKQTGATLLIAKLDRLTRNLNFITKLMDSGIEFKALDMPHANKLTIHIFSALAEHEADLISTRTKQALAELKKKGVKLGKPQNFSDAGRLKGVATNKAKAKANPNNTKAKAFINVLLKQGYKFSQIASQLNEHGFKTSRGKQFQAVQVQRLAS